MQLTEAKEQNPKRWREGRDAIIKSLTMRLQRLATRTYLVITDEEAFQLGSLQLLYLDGFRNIIREGRLDPEIDGLFGVISK